MALGSKNIIISNALTWLLGDGYRMRCINVRSDIDFPDKVRHFDSNGVSFLPRQQQVVVANNGQSVGEVVIDYAICPTDGFAFYKVVNFRFVQEFEPSQAGFNAIQAGWQMGY